MRITLDDIQRLYHNSTFLHGTGNYCSLENSEGMDPFEEGIYLFAPPVILPSEHVQAPEFIGNHLTIFRHNVSPGLPNATGVSVSMFYPLHFG